MPPDGIVIQRLRRRRKPAAIPAAIFSRRALRLRQGIEGCTATTVCGAWGTFDRADLL
jgi:hypothetical protein